MKRTITKALLSVLLASAILAVLATSVFGVASVPGSGWWTRIWVQNVGTTTANVLVSAYDANSTASYTASSSTLGVGATWTIDPVQFANMPAGFAGSGVVSSDQPIVAVTAMQNIKLGALGVTGGKAIADYNGVSAPSKTVYFPTVKNNYGAFTTIFYVQNAGSVPTTFTADFVMFANLSVHYNTTTAVVQPNQMIAILPGDAGVPSTGSATMANFGYGNITANDAQGLISAVWFEYPINQNPMLIIRGTSGFTSADFGNTGFVGVAKNNYARERTSIQLINAESVENTVTINYVGTAFAPGSQNCVGQVYTDTVVLAPNAGTIQQQFTGTTFPAGCLGAATLHGTGQFMALGNEGYVPGTAPLQSGAKAGMLGNAKLVVAAPLFFDDRLLAIDGTTKNVRNGFFVQNTSPTDVAHVVAVFKCAAFSGTSTQTGVFTATTTSIAINPGTALLLRRPFEDQAFYFVGGTPFPQGNASCAVTVTSSDQLLVGWVSQSEMTNGTDKAMYEAFGLP